MVLWHLRRECKIETFISGETNAEGELERAKTNIMVYMQNSVGIGEHSDIVEAIQKELSTMGAAHERLEMIDKYFS